LLKELNIQNSSPVGLYCGNPAAISTANDPVLHDRTKHVEVDKHFIKAKTEEGEIFSPIFQS